MDIGVVQTTPGKEDTMRRVDVCDFETGEIIGTVTTRYNSLEALFDNIGRWRRRHPQYEYVDGDELRAVGIEWNSETYWVREKEEQ